MVVSKYAMGTGMGDTIPGTGVADCEGCVDSETTPAAAAPAGVPRTPGGWRVEVVKVEKAWNVEEESIPEKIANLLLAYGNGYVTLYYHDTWGSCRVTKFVVLNPDGSYLNEGKWIDRSSRRNTHRYKIVKEEEFLGKHAGKELVAYAYVSPSCNASRQFSFRAVFRVVPHG